MVTLQCYISEGGCDEVQQWYISQTAEVRGAIYAVLEGLRHREAHRWRRAPYGELRNLFCAGLREIRVEFPRGEHYRILGYFGASKRVFTLLYAFQKSQDPDYTIACPEAQTRRNHVEQNPARASECRFHPSG